MESININVSVEIGLSQATKDFVTLTVEKLDSQRKSQNEFMLSAFSKFLPHMFAPTGQTNIEQKPAEQKPAEQKPAEQKPAEQKPAEQKPAEQKPAEQKPAEQISIEDVRKALSQKVNEHRAKIKEKLNSFGAPSVTKLDPANYKEMLDFLNSLR